jgi:lipopolysaccharide exporter
LKGRFLSAAATSKAFIRSLFREDGSLKQRATRSGVWVLLAYGLARGLGIIRSVILARLLAPADFGVMRYVDIVVGLLAVVTELGVGAAIIYHQQDDKEFLSTAWLVSFFRGCLLCVLALVAAGPAARFFNEPLLQPVLRVMSITFVISGMNSIGLFLMQRELDFRRLTWLEITASLLSLVVSVVAAYELHNTWALVIGAFVQVIVMMLGSYVIAPFLPLFRWSKQAFRSIFGYGRFLLGADLINYALTYGDNALVGKMLGSEQLGLYGLGYDLANLPTNSVVPVIGKVAFPTYAKLQADVPLLRKAYFQVLKLISLAVVPIVGGMFVLAPLLIGVLYGPKWLPMVPAFTWLCIYGLERAVNSPVGPLFKAVGQTKIVFYLTTLKLILLIVLIIPLTKRYGITGTGMAGGIVAILVAGNAIPQIAKVLHCKVTDILVQIKTAFIATAVMMAVLFAIVRIWTIPTNFWALLCLVVFGAAIYFSLLYLIDRPALKTIVQIIKQQAV